MFFFLHLHSLNGIVLKYIRKIFIFCLILLSAVGRSQETLPIYSDYLSDNLYLLHPAAAGIGNSGKIRLTNRTQWQGVSDAPSLKTLSFHNRYGDKTGLGFLFYSDKNGSYSQNGIQTSYAYHINLSDKFKSFEQLSFGLSGTFTQNQIDVGIFSTSGPDPLASNIETRDNSFYVDFGVSYHKNNFSSYLTVKNLFLIAKKNSVLKPEELRKFVAYSGYFFGDKNKLQYEPSIMTIYEPNSNEFLIDLNWKVYKTINVTRLWMAVSYRKNFGDFDFGGLESITPIVGINYMNYMISYTYTEQLGDFQLAPKGGYHQLTLGVDVFVRKVRLSACPNINSGLF